MILTKHRLLAYSYQLLILLALTGCKKSLNTSDSSDSLTIRVDSIKNANLLNYSDLFSGIELIKLQTKPESLIGRIDKILYDDSLFFILDQVQSKSVFVFDRKGNFKYTIGRHGKGPGEFDEPSDISLDLKLKQVLIYNRKAKSILYYNYSGDYQRELPLNIYFKSFSCYESGSLALYLDNSINANQKPYNLYLCSKDNKVLNRQFLYSKGQMVSHGGLSFFSLSKKHLLLSPGFSNQIFEIVGTQTKQLYKIDFLSHNIPSDLFREDTLAVFFKKVYDNHSAYLSSFCESSRYLQFTFVYRKIAYHSYFSKETKTLKFSNIFLNDMLGMTPGGRVFTTVDDKFVCFIEPSQFLWIQQLLNEPKISPQIIKDKVASLIISNMGYSKYQSAITATLKRSKYLFTKEDVDLINSIKLNDNPVLLVQSMKDF